MNLQVVDKDVDLRYTTPANLLPVSWSYFDQVFAVKTCDVFFLVTFVSVGSQHGKTLSVEGIGHWDVSLFFGTWASILRKTGGV